MASRWTVAAIIVAGVVCAVPGCAADESHRRSPDPQPRRPQVERDEPPPKDCSVVVRVRGPRGDAVAGARLRAYPAYPRDRGRRLWGSIYVPPADPEKPLADAATDHRGRGHITGLGTGKFRIEIEAAGLARTEMRTAYAAETPARELDVHLEPGHAFEGLLLSAAGEPLAAHRVIVATRGDTFGPSSSVGHFQAVTDEAGRFHVDGLFRDVYDVWAYDRVNGHTRLRSVLVPEVKRATLWKPRGGVIRGRVVALGGGRPVHGAKVGFVTNDGFGDRPRISAHTDGNGEFEISPADPFVQLEGVTVEADGYARTEFDRPHGDGRRGTLRSGEILEVEYKLPRAARVSGVVQGPDGLVEGAEVVASFKSGRFPFNAIRRRTTTDRQGRYSLEGLPVEPVVVRARADGLRTAGAPGNDELRWRSWLGEPGDHDALELRPGDRVEHPITLEPDPYDQTVSITFRGRVLRPDGRPAAYADVRVHGSRHRAYDAGAGRTLTGPDGTFEMTARSTPDSFKLFASSAGVGWFQRVFEEGLTEDLTDLELTLEPPAPARMLRGSVRLDSGDPASGAVVRVAQQMSGRGRDFAAWDRWWPIAVDREGRFEVAAEYHDPGYRDTWTPFPEKEIVLVGLRPGTAPAFSRPVSLEGDGDHAPVELVLTEGHAIHGRVVDSANRPVAEAQIALDHGRFFFSQSNWPPVHAPAIRGAVHATTDAEGRFTVPHLRATQYVVVVHAHGFLRWSRPLAPPLDEPLKVQLTRESYVGGVVVDAGGRPIAGAEVRPAGENSFLFERTTNPDGSFLIDALPEGSVRLTVAPPETRKDLGPTTTAELSTGAADAAVRIVLQGPEPE